MGGTIIILDVPGTVTRDRNEALHSQSRLANRKRQCHRAKDVHPRILAHPRTAFGRETESEFIGKPIGKDLSQGVFGPLTIAKEDSSHLFPLEQDHAHVLTIAHRHDSLGELPDSRSAADRFSRSILKNQDVRLIMSRAASSSRKTGGLETDQDFCG